MRGAARSVRRTTTARRATTLALVILCATAITTAQLARADDLGQAGPDREVFYRADADLKLRVDGNLDEPVWDLIEPITNHRTLSPATLAPPALDSEARLVHSERGLYVGFRLFQPPGKSLIRITERDARLNRDYVHITLDNSGSGLYGHWFSVALGDSLVDGTVYPERSFYSEWDGTWRGATTETDYGWSAEMFIPWKLIELPKAKGGIARMGFYTSRTVGYLDERYGFPGLTGIAPEFMSALQGILLRVPPPSQSFSLQPFVSASTEGVTNQDRRRAGIDLHWRPSRGLLLSASIAPDFGTTDSDDVVLNLGALETFFAEKRQFFLEGRSIFFTSPRVSRGFNGYGRFMLVNTRRIGAPIYSGEVAPDGFRESQIDLFTPTDLLGAMRVNGQTGNFRFGVLTAFEDARDLSLPARAAQDSGGAIGATTRAIRAHGQNFIAARGVYEKKTSDNYRALGLFTTNVDGNGRRARVAGIDIHTLSKGGVWSLDGQFMYADTAETTDIDTPLDQGQDVALTLDIQHAPSPLFRHSFHTDYFGRDFELNDLGFALRNNQVGTTYYIERNFPQYQRSKRIDSMKFTGTITHNWNLDGQLARAGYNFEHEIDTPSLTTFTAKFGFFPARWEDLQSFGNGVFRIEDRGNFEVKWRGDISKRNIFNVNASTWVGSIGGLSGRFGAGLKSNFSDNISIELDATYRKRRNWLLYTSGRALTTYNATNLDLAFKADFFINARNQFSTSLNWVGVDATQRGYYRTPDTPGSLVAVAIDPAATTNRNFIVSDLVWQTKYRWEFAPLSELILVYNHLADVHDDSNRSFNSLFSKAIDQPIVKQFILKVSYRYDG